MPQGALRNSQRLYSISHRRGTRSSQVLSLFLNMWVQNIMRPVSVRRRGSIIVPSREQPAPANFMASSTSSVAVLAGFPKNAIITTELCVDKHCASTSHLIISTGKFTGIGSGCPRGGLDGDLAVERRLDYRRHRRGTYSKLKEESFIPKFRDRG